jgi:hypothetical protein
VTSCRGTQRRRKRQRERGGRRDDDERLFREEPAADDRALGLGLALLTPAPQERLFLGKLGDVRAEEREVLAPSVGVRAPGDEHERGRPVPARSSAVTSARAELARPATRRQTSPAANFFARSSNACQPFSTSRFL